MTGTSIVLIGCNELASLLLDYGREESVRVDGFAVHSAYRDIDEFRELPVVDVEALPPEQVVINAVGYSQRLRARENVHESLSAAHHVESFVSSASHVGPRTQFGAGVVLLPGSFLQPGSGLGAGTVVWPLAIVCHDSVLGRCCYVSPNATICGNVTIGDRVFVGAGATIRDGVSIGSDSVIGAGAVVTSDVPAGSLVIGVPARTRPVPEELVL